MVNDAKDDDERDAPACVASFLPLLLDLDLSACLVSLLWMLVPQECAHSKKRRGERERA